MAKTPSETISAFVLSYSLVIYDGMHLVMATYYIRALIKLVQLNNIYKVFECTQRRKKNACEKWFDDADDIMLWSTELWHREKEKFK